MKYDNILETIGRMGIYLTLVISAGIIVMQYSNPSLVQQKVLSVIGFLGFVWVFQPILKMENWRKE